MDEPTPPPAAPSSDRLWLLALLLIVLALRVWLICNTEVTARDSIGFIRYSLMFDRMAAGEVDDSANPPKVWSWSTILKGAHQHPGYPVVVWVAAAPLRAVWGTTPEVMRVAAQLVSLAASVLLALVMFRIGKYLWNCYVGFFAALVFQVLPIPGHHLSDGISDGLFLLMAMSAVDAILRARDAGSLKGFALGGAFIGLAYLVRPEGLLVLPAAFLFCCGLQFVREHRTTWRLTAQSLAALTLAWAVVGAPYYVATGAITLKPTLDHMLRNKLADPHAKADPESVPAVHGSRILFAATFPKSNSLPRQSLQALQALAAEVSQAFNYVGVAFVIWAFLFCRGTVARRPGAFMLAAYALVHASILIALGIKVSYVSDRHVLVLIALGSYPCVIGVAHLASLVVRRMESVDPRTFLDHRLVMLAAGSCLAVLIVICGAKTVKRLHGNRAGNHQAGIWLAENLRAGDEVYDDHNWSHYYAGQVFTEFQKVTAPADARGFVVLTRSKDELHKHRELLEADLRRDGKLVFWWPKQDADQARIVIYATPHNFVPEGWLRIGGVFMPDPARGFRPGLVPAELVPALPVALPVVLPK